MNRLYKILLILIVALASCNPMKNINKQIEDQAKAPRSTFNYTLTSADYSTIKDYALKFATTHADSVEANKIASSEYLMGNYDHTFIPFLLKELYPALGDKSSAQVSYNYYVGPTTKTVMYEGANQYKLSADDYNAINDSVGFYGSFYPDYSPQNYIPDFLKTKFPDAADSTLEFVTYNYANQKPTSPPLALDADFKGSGDLQNFTVADSLGPQTWYATNYGAKMSGYAGSDVPNVDYLISPAIDLSGTHDPCFIVSQIAKYVGSWDNLQILVSDDYSGDAYTATWVPMTIKDLPTGNDWNPVTSEKVDLSSFAGKTIHIAFKYVSTNSEAATWEVEWLKVYKTHASSGIGTQSVFYRFLNGTWKTEPGVYALSSDDYNSMGAPGKYDNFSSSEPPENYVPQFLSMKYPYAQEGDQMYVAYMYYSGGTHLRVDQYTYTNSVWTMYNPVTVATSPFVNAAGYWVFDPTVYKTMTVDDYQMIVDVVKNTHPDLVNSYNDGEDYYGADAYYGDFNAQISNRSGQADFQGLSEDEALKLIDQRISEGIIVWLQQAYPDATTQVSGVDQKYVITYNVYPNTGGSTLTYTATFQCVKSGPSPDFKAVGEPVQDK